jgi:rhodanese-related sulfurtransferase
MVIQGRSCHTDSIAIFHILFNFSGHFAAVNHYTVMKKLFFSIFTLMLVGSFACTGSAQSTLTADQTEAMLKKDATVQLIDLRTPEEIKRTGMIQGARAVNFYAPDFDAQIARLDKSKPVVVYCAAGGRSPQAAAKMNKMGFSKVYDYSGGMNDWKSKGKKTVQ